MPYFFLNRYLRLMPLYWLSLGILLLVNFKIGYVDNLKTVLLKIVPEIFGLQMFWRPRCLNGTFWYISAMLFTQPLIYWFLQKHKESYIQIIAPLSLLCFIAYAWSKYGHVDLALAYPGFFRAYCEIGFGCVVFCIVKYVNKNYEVGEGLMTTIEIALLATILIIMYRTRRDYKDFLMIFLIAGLILVTFLNQGILTRILNRRAFGKLGLISYPMYLNQITLKNIAYKYFPGRSFWKMSAFLLVALVVVSIIELGLCKIMKKLFSQFASLTVKIKE